MAHDIIWSKVILETFIEEALLTNEEEAVLRKRVKGCSRASIAMDLNMSVSNVDKVIARIRRKYDTASKYNPLLPPRKLS